MIITMQNNKFLQELDAYYSNEVYVHLGVVCIYIYINAITNLVVWKFETCWSINFLNKQTL